MDKEIILNKIKAAGIVAVIRAESADKASRIVDACIEGGIPAIELTFTVPGAHKVIEELAKRYTEDEIILGAGTVLDSETARIAMLSGAGYIVSPSLNEGTIKLCNRYRVPIMAGIMTPTEAVTAMELGVDILKAFPGDVLGPKFIKALHGPLPQAQIMPTGGVDITNVADWIKAGAVAVGAGSSLTGAAKSGDYKMVTETAAEFVKIIQNTRSGL